MRVITAAMMCLLSSLAFSQPPDETEQLEKLEMSLKLLDAIGDSANSQSFSVKELLDAGADPNFSPFGSFYPLQSAVLDQNMTAFQSLLDAGARLDVRDEENDLTLFEEFLIRGDEYSSAVLKSSTGPIDGEISNAFGPIAFSVVRLNDIEAISNFFQRVENLDPNEKSVLGRNLLMEIVISGRVDVLQSFVSEIDGIDVTETDMLGDDAVRLAIKARNSQVLKILLTELSGWNLNQADMMGDTPLHIAVTSGDVETVSILLKYGKGIIPQHRNRMGKSARDMAPSDMRKILDQYVDPSSY